MCTTACPPNENRIGVFFGVLYWMSSIAKTPAPLPSPWTSDFLCVCGYRESLWGVGGGETFKYWIYWIILGSCFFENKYYYGYNLESIPCANQSDNWTADSPEECRKLCKETPNCFKFTWIEPPGIFWKAGARRCCLKQKEEIMNATYKVGRISGPENCGKFSHVRSSRDVNDQNNIRG